jgi:hypothetical protein
VAVEVTVTLGEVDPQRPTVDVTVDLAPIERLEVPDGAMVPVKVFETHHGTNIGDVEDIVDSSSVLVAPTFLVAPPQWFADRTRATHAMVGAIEGLDDRFGLDDLVIDVSHEPLYVPVLVLPPFAVQRHLAVLDAARERWGDDTVDEAIARRVVPELPEIRELGVADG